MSDIFISYASEDKKKAGLLAKVLEQQGWSVWWDREIPAGRTFAEVIEQELDLSECVVVLWSKTSISSHWVKTEASEGLNREILVPVLIEEVKIPLEFRRIQTVQLVYWQGEMSHPEVNKLIVAITTILSHTKVKKGEKKRKKTNKAKVEQEYLSAQLETLKFEIIELDILFQEKARWSNKPQDLSQRMTTFREKERLMTKKSNLEKQKQILETKTESMERQASEGTSEGAETLD